MAFYRDHILLLPSPLEIEHRSSEQHIVEATMTGSLISRSSLGLHGDYVWYMYMGNCQNYGPFLGPYYNTGPNTGPNLGDPKRDHNFDNHPYAYVV